MANVAEGSCNPVDANPNSFAQNQGQQLPPSLRHEMESSFGADLSKVMVHENHAATHLKATSFAQGNDIYFQPGQYDPHSNEGQRLIAHELAHVVQQSGGGVNREAIQKSLESEAESMAQKALGL